MRYRRVLIMVTTTACVVAGPLVINAQTRDFLATGVGTGPVVRDAPFSLEGVTTSTTVLQDGTRIERQMPMRLYRDSQGRVRREQTILGLATLNPASDSVDVVTIVDPVEGFSYSLHKPSLTARRTPLDRQEPSGMPPPPPPPPPPAAITDAGAPPPPLPAPSTRPVETTLGTRDIDGRPAIGTKRTLTIPLGTIGNNRAIEIVEERWVSRDLGVLLSSRRMDPRTGLFTFRVTRLDRGEPPANLFNVPSNYMVLNTPAPQRPSAR